MYNYLDIPTKLFSIIIFSMILVLILNIFVFDRKSTLELRFKALSPDVLLLITYILAILLVQLIPSMENNIFVRLSSISFAGWLRFFAGLMISIFLPGYAILSSFEHRLDRISISTLSVLLSIFVNTITGFVAVIFSQSILTSVLTINIAIIFAVIIKTIYDRIKQPHYRWICSIRIKIGSTETLLLLLCLFQLSIAFSVFLLSNFAVPNGDMWDQASIAAHAQTGELSRFGITSYPPFFSIHLLVVSQISGLPIINSDNLLGLLSIFTILAFYFFAIKLSHSKKVASLATFVWAIFGSFTFLVLPSLSGNTQSLLNSFYSVASGTTQQINSVYTSTVFYAYAPAVLDTISVLAIAALLIYKEKSKILYAIETLLVANLFLIHIPEIISLSVFFLAAILLGFSRIKDLTFITLGVLIGVVMSFGVYSPIYEQYMVFFSAVLFVFSILLMKLGGSLKLQIRMMTLIRYAKALISKKSFRLFSATIIIFSYVTLTLIWKAAYIDGNNVISGNIYTLGALPTYFMPIVFGVPLLISVIYLATQLVSFKQSFDTRELKVLVFLILALLFAFFFGKAITIANTLGYAIYLERRVIFAFGAIVFSIIAAYGLIKLFSYAKQDDTKKQILAIGLGLLILTSSGSVLLSASYWSNDGLGTYVLSTNESEALQFLKSNVNSSTVVLTYSSESNAKVGLTGATTINKYWLPFSSDTNTIPKAMLSYVDYIYVTKQDLIQIQESQNTYMQLLLDILPVIYNNSEIVILKVPQVFKTSSNNLSVSVIIPNNSTTALASLLLLDYLDISYRVCFSWDDAAFSNSKVAISLGDIPNDFVTSKYLNWIGNGGHLIVLSQNNGYFSDLIKLRSAMKNLFEEKWLSSSDLKNWTIVPSSSLSESDVSISKAYSYNGSNSLMLNSTLDGGILDMTHPREGTREFPFSIGTWFNLAENRSSVGELMILGDGISSAITLWNNDYKIDYFYDGGKVVYGIGDISPGSWQKLELLFPNPTTCEVYLNDTLIFTGPRSTQYDSAASNYAEQNFPFHIRAVGNYLALWNGLHYSVPDSVSANGIVYKENIVPIDTVLNMSNKESFDNSVQVTSWYTFNGEPLAPFIFVKNIGAGVLTYVDLAIPNKNFPNINNYQTTFLQSFDALLSDYLSQNKNITSYPITLRGDEKLKGSIDIGSDATLFKGYNFTDFTYSIELANGTSILADTQQLALNSPNDFVISLSGTATLHPFQAQYSEIIIPKDTQVTVTFSQNYSLNETSTVHPTNENTTWHNIKKATIYSNSSMILIVKTPFINVNGTVQFENSVIDYPYSDLIKQGGGSLKLQGEIAYEVSMSDEKGFVAVGKYLNLDGSVNYGYPTIWNLELPIASLSSLISSQNLALMITIFIFVLWFLLVLNARNKSKDHSVNSRVEG